MVKTLYREVISRFVNMEMSEFHKNSNDTIWFDKLKAVGIYGYSKFLFFIQNSADEMANDMLIN